MAELRWLTLYKPQPSLVALLIDEDAVGPWRSGGDFFSDANAPAMSMEEIRELSSADPHPYEGWTVERFALPWVVWRGA